MKYLKLKFLLMFFALAMAIPPAWAAEVTDVLNRAFTGVTGTSYTSWSDKTGTSGAVYAGNSAAGNDAIQLRAKNGSAIITTASAGKVKSISVTWNSNTSSGRILDIYCSNSAYTLTNFANGTTGTKVGSIEYGTSTSLAINTDYNYIAIKSNDGALFLDQIEIVWETGGSSLTPITTFSFPQDSYTVTMGESFTAPTLSVDPDGAASEVVYSSSNTNVAMVSGGKVTAKAVGYATISAYTSSGASTCLVHVTNQSQSSKIKLCATTASSYAGCQYAFWQTGASNPVWSSSDTSVADIDSNGVMTAKKAGTATIYCTEGKETSFCNFTVYSGVSTGISAESMLLINGSTGKLTAK